MAEVQGLAGQVGVQAAWGALSVASASYYRWLHPGPSEPKARVRPPLAFGWVGNLFLVVVEPLKWYPFTHGGRR
jgi:hypothetical protein